MLGGGPQTLTVRLELHVLRRQMGKNSPVQPHGKWDSCSELERVRVI